MKLRTVAAALVVAALLGAGITLGVQALFGGGGYSGPPAGQLAESWLQGVNINGLADEGIYLSQPPSDYHPKTSSGFAKHATDGQYSSVSARQILIAHLQTQFMGGFDGQVYIINFDPTEIPPECPGAHTIYAVAFVDADTGKYLSSTSVESPAPTPCRHGIDFSGGSPTPATLSVP
jgi:hypothetical protein